MSSARRQFPPPFQQNRSAFPRAAVTLAVGGVAASVTEKTDRWLKQRPWKESSAAAESRDKDSQDAATGSFGTRRVIFDSSFPPRLVKRPRSPSPACYREVKNRPAGSALCHHSRSSGCQSPPSLALTGGVADRDAWLATRVAELPEADRALLAETLMWLTIAQRCVAHLAERRNVSVETVLSDLHIDPEAVLYDSEDGFAELPS